MEKIVKPGLLAGVAILIVSFILTPIINWLMPTIAQEYINPDIFRPWTDPLMSLYFLYPFVLGLVLAWVWMKIKKVIPGKNDSQKVSNFAIGYWLIAGLPGMLMTYASFQLSLAMVMTWSLSGLIDAYVASYVINRFSK